MAQVSVPDPIISEHILIKLAREIAMDIQPIDNILRDNGVDGDQWENIQANTRFRMLLETETSAWGSALNTQERLRLKSAAALEEWLPELFTRMNDRNENLNAKVEAGKYSMSLFVWYFGTDKRYEDVPHHMMLLGPRYEALLKDIFKRHHLADDFSLYLHRPTVTDPGMAPAGCDTFYVLSPVPHLQSATNWAEQAEQSEAWPALVSEMLNFEHGPIS